MTKTINHIDDTRPHAGAMDNMTPPDPRSQSVLLDADGSPTSTRQRSSPSTTPSTTREPEAPCFGVRASTRRTSPPGATSETRAQRPHRPALPATARPIPGSGRSPG